MVKRAKSVYLVMGYGWPFMICATKKEAKKAARQFEIDDDAERGSGEVYECELNKNLNI